MRLHAMASLLDGANLMHYRFGLCRGRCRSAPSSKNICSDLTFRSKAVKAMQSDYGAALWVVTGGTAQGGWPMEHTGRCGATKYVYVLVLFA